MDRETHAPESESARHPVENSPQHIVVLGPGGVGGLIAALASGAGHRVTCLASESTADVLRRDGIAVSSAQFGHFTAPVEADTTLCEPADLVFVTVKATSLEAALERLDPDAIGDALIVPLLNGVDHMTLLRERYSPEQVTGGVIRVEATRTRPGIVEHASSFADIDLASATTDRARLDDIPMVEHQDVGAHLANDGEIVGDEEQGQPVVGDEVAE